VPPPIPKRLRHIVQRNHLASMLSATYAEAQNVDEEDAHERLTRAVEDPELQEALYGALAAGLAMQPGASDGDDALLDRLSKALGKRAARMKAAKTSPGVSAVMVKVNLLVELAPISMRAALETDKGRALVEDGLRELGRHLVGQLLK
jgi:hypothetical protein